MMKHKLIYSLIIVAVTGLFVSCDEDNDFWNSSAQLQMTQNFDVVADAEEIQVDFSSGETISFEGEWNQETNWKIIIVGNESGQTDTIKGCSKSLEGISWNGSTSKKETYFPSSIMNKKFNIDLFGKASASEETFVEGETCTILLAFDDFEGVDTCKTVVKIASAASQDFYKSDYCIFGDWESSSTEQLYINNGSTSKISKQTSGLVIPEGKAYCMMAGTEKGGDWYIDGMGFTFANTSGWSQPNGVYPITSADTATTYINFFMYGFSGYCERTTIFMSLNNGDDIECELQGDRISVSEGWHGVSIPVSRFKSNNKNFDYNKVDKIVVTLFSNGEAGEVKTAVDFMVITKKAPLFPIYQN